MITNSFRISLQALRLKLVTSELMPPLGAFSFVVLHLIPFMATSFDFTIISQTDVPGISLVVSHNENAFSYITEEADMCHLEDGSVPLATDKVGDFISDAGWDKYSCELV